MVGQKACRYPKAYIKSNKLQESGKTPRSVLTKALRVAVQEQVEAFRMKHEPGTLCPITKKEIMREMGDCEVDHHKKPFKDIVDEFVESHPELDLRIAKKDGMNEVLINKSADEAWKKYHEEHADLRLLSKEGHRLKTLKGVTYS